MPGAGPDPGGASGFPFRFLLNRAQNTDAGQTRIVALAQFFQNGGYNSVHLVSGCAGSHLQLFGEPAGDFLLSVHEAMVAARRACSALKHPSYVGQPPAIQSFT